MRDSIVLLTKSLTEIPPNTKQALTYFEKEQEKAQVVLSFIETLYINQLKTTELLNELSNSLIADRHITVTGLANFFFIQENLVNHFYLHGDKVFSNNTIVSEESEVISKLSVELEKFFGNKDIYFGVLLQSIKRYLKKKQYMEDDKKNDVVGYAEHYLKNHVTRKRTKIALKELRNNFPNLKPAQIKQEMINSNKFKTITSDAGVVFFQPI